jgi:hypothetical protein
MKPVTAIEHPSRAPACQQPQSPKNIIHPLVSSAGKMEK